MRLYKQILLWCAAIGIIVISVTGLNPTMNHHVYVPFPWQVEVLRIIGLATGAVLATAATHTEKVVRWLKE